MRSRLQASTAMARRLNHLFLDPPAVLLYELVALNASLGEYTNGNEVSRLTARHRRTRPSNHTRETKQGLQKKLVHPEKAFVLIMGQAAKNTPQTKKKESIQTGAKYYYCLQGMP